MSNEKKTPFKSGLQFRGTQGLGIYDMRTAALADAPAFCEKFVRSVEEGKLRWGTFHNTLRDFYRALDGIQTTVRVPGIASTTRAIDTDLFPALAGELTIAGINDAYQAVPAVADQLTRRLDDNKKFTHVVGVGVLDKDDPDVVREGKEFPEIGAIEERYTIGHKRNGRMFKVTREMIEENDVPTLERLSMGLGELAAEKRENQVLRRVCDIDGSGSSPTPPYALTLNGTGVSLYQTDNDPLTRLNTSGNRYTNNALVDTTSLDNCRERLNSNRNYHGERIYIPMERVSILVPDALLSTAKRILGSEFVPGVFNELNPWGTRGWQPKVITTPYLDDLSTSAWYYGDFQRQFTMKVKLDFENASLMDPPESWVKSRIAALFRLSWDFEIGATDYTFVIQNLSSTTPPSA